MAKVKRMSPPLKGRLADEIASKFADNGQAAAQMNMAMAEQGVTEVVDSEWFAKRRKGTRRKKTDTSPLFSEQAAQDKHLQHGNTLPKQADMERMEREHAGNGESVPVQLVKGVKGLLANYSAEQVKGMVDLLR